ncbi:MAG: hypothetical protein WBM41_16395 [Arenicellales bacterium]
MPIIIYYLFYQMKVVQSDAACSKYPTMPNTEMSAEWNADRGLIPLGQ